MSAIVNAISAFAAWISEMFFRFLEWVTGLVESVALFVMEQVLTFVLFLVDLVPIPSWLSPSTIQNVFGAISGTVGFWLQPFAIPYGVSIIVGAYALRFLVRRLPVVG